MVSSKYVYSRTSVVDAVLTLSLLHGCAQGACYWNMTQGSRCGYDCGVDFTIGGSRYKGGVNDVNSCLNMCRKQQGCVAINYAKKGTGGSGGPGSTSQSSGACYFRSAVNCGNTCDKGRICYELTGDDRGVNCPTRNDLQTCAASPRSVAASLVLLALATTYFQSQ
eukprot:TRINITY_DN46566_c0_g1_i1.p1 TRINITY_DN46566_c0_g1~~TRINITY_DN46566_c0_g1_i1.p1  ORF type:complete len:166 (+),score=16.26 TRINITY_DN46566_c0_g1_i1:61-558(+)